LATLTSADRSRYDKRYFDRWYRNPAQRVFSPAERSRRVAVAVATTEYVLGRRLRTVLDVGAGEGHWRALRPRARYTGLDPSEYVVRRFGTRRNIRLGSVESLTRSGLRGPYDLVLAVGFLNLLSPGALARALRSMRPLVGGVALLELFTAEDPLTGDIRKYRLSPSATYRRLLARNGFRPVGLHLYATAEAGDSLAALEYMSPRNPSW
jgi:SAM-dependent methyltransferase